MSLWRQRRFLRFRQTRFSAGSSAFRVLSGGRFFVRGDRDACMLATYRREQFDFSVNRGLQTGYSLRFYRLLTFYPKSRAACRKYPGRFVYLLCGKAVIDRKILPFGAEKIPFRPREAAGNFLTTFYLPLKSFIKWACILGSVERSEGVSNGKDHTQKHHQGLRKEPSRY